jgi:hypothetical protein
VMRFPNSRPPFVVLMCPACLWAAKRLRVDGPSIREIEPTHGQDS